MPRGFQMLARALAGIALLSVVAQCGGSGSPAAAPTTVDETVASVTSAVVDITSPARTTFPVAPSTTVAPPTTVVRPTTTTSPVPTTTTTPPIVVDPNCPLTPHGAVIDRARQRAFLCDSGVALAEFVITTAVSQPDPGIYPVYAKSMNASSTFGGHRSTMTHFVAFSHGKRTGARIAFHTVPVLRNGEFVQPLESLGTQELHGDSAGCIRVLPEQGQVVWDWLQIGDEVRVIT